MAAVSASIRKPWKIKASAAGHIGGTDTSGPFSADGIAGRNGLEKDPPDEGQATVVDGLKLAWGKMNHAAVMVGKTAAFVLYSLPWICPLTTCRTTLTR